MEIKLIDGVKHKQCVMGNSAPEATACGEWKPLNKFRGHTCKNGKRTYESRCFSCSNKSRLNHTRKRCNREAEATKEFNNMLPLINWKPGPKVVTGMFGCG